MASTIFEVYRAGGMVVPQQLVRFGLTCLLAYSLIRGWRPGRWIAVVLCGLAGVFGLFAGVSLMQGSSLALILFVMGMVYILCGVVLLCGKAAIHFNGRPNSRDPTLASVTRPARQPPPHP